ncbi:hypothetical protein Q8F55_004618 [Vanrija albida]|uniref:Uncharacterized protein n=1 Tax=Vanrija albida TaxID=181172 RepID=A0ABR3Q7H4_9TREE
MTLVLATNVTDEAGLTTKARPKGAAAVHDFKRIVETIYDPTFKWRLALERVQFVALFLLEAYGVGQPGELAIPAQYESLKDSLSTRTNPGSLECCIRLLKRKRDDEGTFKKVFLYEEETTGYDPVVALLAVAFEDDAFENVSSYAQLKKVSPPCRHVPELDNGPLQCA